MSPSGTYSAIDPAAANTTPLFRYQFTPTTHLACCTVVRGETLYFPGNVIEGGTVRSALLAFDAVTLTLDGAPIGVASGFLYYRHNHEAKRVPTAGGVAETPHAVAPSFGDPRDDVAAVVDIKACRDRPAAGPAGPRRPARPPSS
ncbi:hypothetical protein [Polyangium sorediatum]|uniref:Uncharacterized protein n=1 Tax=Polyangium sorediatum TaxID=889274 RepID=A0ABT6P5J7_9BACT|nr:hypothetical protein [Polyangium sorediatum]MDI1435811.1 hypothetical protein [Polyangium sorediatum]